MRRKHIDKVVVGQDDYSDRDCIIHVLSLEYKTLRAELLVRVSGRFQFLGLMTTAAALIVTGFFSRSVFGNSDWIAGILAAAVFSFGLMNFWILGRHIAVLSARIAEIENRINTLAPARENVPELLSWESERQKRGRYNRVSMNFLARRI